jgi:hypothetical protein
MSLIHYARPFLELGNCKEFRMPRKTTGTTVPNRSKKAQVADSPAPVQVTPQITPEARLDVQKVVAEFPRREEVRKDAPKIATSVQRVPVNLASNSIEEEIRRRAYELYLQRRATAGGAMDDPNQDWLIAEREILSRQGGERQFAAAAGQARA